MSFTKKVARILLLCAVLLALGMTLMMPKQSLADSDVPPPDTSGQTRIYIWKDAEGVTHIGDKAAPVEGADSEGGFLLHPQAPDTPMVRETPSTREEPVIQPEGKVQSPSLLQLQEERKALNNQFIHAKNKGNGYAKIRLRRLLDANSKAQERLRGQTPPASPSPPGQP
ncbi:MAG: hypothetical protein RRY20_02220 [Bilophila sp.]